MALTILAFRGVGLFAGEWVRNRRMAIELLHKTQQEARRRIDSVTEVRALLESSPIGLLTVDSQGKIGMANASACRLLGFSSGSPEGDPIDRYIPTLASLLQSKQLASLMQIILTANGRRRTGEAFFSQAWA